jgi:hypothetical protein
MPPAPISRSSTYFPKIWGNIARGVAAFWLSLGSVACGASEPELVTHTLRVYSLPGCAASGGAELELTAFGPFSPSNTTAEVLPLAAVDQALPFPARTRAIGALARDQSGRYIGYGELRGNALALVLWPEARSCAVFEGAFEAGFPRRGGGQALGYAPNLGLVLAAGGDDRTSSAVVGALSFDVRTGEAHAVDASARAVLGEPRAYATVTEFGEGVLVTGGEDPIHDVPAESRVLRQTAEIYDPKARRFELELVELREARTRHAALVLASGETLLIGGRGAFGTALRALETVSPVTRTSSLSNLATLEVGRIEPTALRLSDDRILVAGGYDAEGRPVSSLERLDANATRAVPYEIPPELPARFDRAFVAMAGGSVLAVGGCEEREPSPGEDCSACRRGCPPGEFDAFWIERSGAVTEIKLDVEAPRPLLLPGSDGSPWLIVETATGVRALRFNPFAAKFEALGDLGELPDPRLVAPVSIAPDHFVWIGPGEYPALFGFRASTRGRYSNDVGLVAVTHPNDPTWPLHLVPDRAKAGPLYAERALLLEPGDAAVYVADALFGDVVVELEFSGGPPPAVLLGEEMAPCGFPEHAADEPERVRLERAGDELVFERGGETRSCEGPSGELAIGLRAETGPTTVRAWSLERPSP